MTIYPQKLLICCDMDRTLLPNGPQPESARARPLMTRLFSHPGVVLAYVSGRHLALALSAILEYRLPLPDFLACDVGSALFTLKDGNWQADERWRLELESNWRGLDAPTIARLLAEIPGLSLQGADRQARFKHSFYVDKASDKNNLLAKAYEIVAESAANSRLIWSVDENDNSIMLDILPECATKKHAVEFLQRSCGIENERCIFAGDSGNDMEVMASHLNSILVANASQEVRDEARQEAAANGNLATLYLAQGGFLGMNGNYSAGVVEGVCKRFPEMLDWLNELSL